METWCSVRLSQSLVAGIGASVLSPVTRPSSKLFFFRLSPRQDFASYLLTGKPAAGDDGNTADLEELHFGGSSGCRIWVTLGGDMVD